jgi:hypothetical protein
VLWEQDNFLKDGSSAELWSIADTAETKPACEARGAELRKTVYGTPTPGVEVSTGPMWAHERSPGLGKHVRLRCLPDTVDPRGPKASGRRAATTRCQTSS